MCARAATAQLVVQCGRGSQRQNGPLGTAVSSWIIHPCRFPIAASHPRQTASAGPSAGAVSLVAMGSGFWAQIVSMPQSLPYGGDRILDAQHISAFSGEDVNCPVCAKHPIDFVRYLDIGHILASGEAADFLECYALQLMSSNERFGHRASPLNQSILRMVASVLRTQTLPL